jgi:predicted transposase/invertase (TIGR01784 family)
MEKQEYRKSVAEYADVQLMMDYSKKEGMQRGERRGLKKGIQQALTAVAKSGFKKGMSVETVSELTGLPIQEVKLLLMSL